ncbi:MAG: TonB-dependent receptor [Bacteroidales bacterium]|nr:TonB-dependent receptor [Bacteroidales bacterium]
MKKSTLLLLLLLLSFLWINLYAQTSGIKLSESYNNLNWQQFAAKAETELNISFFYYPDSIPDIAITFSHPNNDLIFVLNENFKQYHIKASADTKGNIFMNKENVIKTKLPDDFFSLSMSNKLNETSAKEIIDRDEFLKTNHEYISKTFVVGNKKAGVYISEAAVTGKILSFNDSLPLPGATIYIDQLEKGAVTDNNGFFTLAVPKGKYNLKVRNVGYEETSFKVEVLSSGSQDFYILKKVFLMETVEIRSEADHNVKSVQMGVEKISIKDIKEIPTVLGERDIIKVALLLPGVQSIGEGSSGFNVRGSPADQNIFYISDVPVYNTSHLFGFFSAFNSDAISEFKLYKSSIPAKYGGRLSSIFDIQPWQGNMEKFGARGGISPITARLLAEGPIIKNKLSYMAGFRATYSDWVLNFVNVPEVKNSKGNFGDGIVNLTYDLNARNRIKLFGYYSYDNINLASKVNNSYENTGASINWYHSFNKNNGFDFSFASSIYNFTEDNYEYSVSAYSLNYELQHKQINFDFTSKPSENHTLNYGISSILYNLDNGRQIPYGEESLIIPTVLGEEKGLESGIFVSDQWTVNPLLTVYAGLRYNYFAYLGPNDVFKYRENASKIPENIIDTLHFSDNQIIKDYKGLDYRFGITYLINQDVSVKAGYNRMHQYIFMLSNTIAVSPTDKWKLSNYNIEPMRGDQFSLGFYSNFENQKYELSIEGYYKKTENLVEYKDGAELILNKYPEQDVLQGKLDAYGIELMLRKTSGKLNGWVNYTWSKSTVLVDNKITGEQNNFGIAYPANYDKPHSINVVANYKISKRVSFSGNVVYSTGRPITYPTSIYYQDGQPLLNYSLRNEYRIPDYFRMDASFKVEGNLRKRKWLHGSWIFSVYNITGRNNAYSVYFKSEEGYISGYKLSIFAVPIFSVTYDFKLGNYAD